LSELISQKEKFQEDYQRVKSELEVIGKRKSQILAPFEKAGGRIFSIYLQTAIMINGLF